jgi:hypothetical protein
MSRQAEVQEGDVIAGYRVLGVLGVGGSGTVYRAQRVVDGALVALKLLNAEHARNEGERQRFAREAEVVRQLAHPHVVALLDYGFDELPYLAFPLLTGRTLEARIAAEGKVGWGLTGRFSEQALSALEVAHGLSIAHRDLKPANIFCCQHGPSEHIQILDFGTAKIVGPKPASQQEVTRMGVLVGTPRYMAPEQVRGEALTPAADVYSFGLVMAEMLLGRPLVTGATDFEMFVMQGSDAPHVLPDEILGSPFAAVIERAIAKPLEVRYRLASQMLADVRAILARYDQGAQTQRLGADLEATRFIGAAPAPAARNESAAKLRTAFNAIAGKSAAAAPQPAPPSDESALPTLFMPVVQAPPEPPEPPVIEIAAEETQPAGPAPHLLDATPAATPPAMLVDPTPAPTPVAKVKRSSRQGVALGAVLALAVAAGGVAYLRRASDAPLAASAQRASASATEEPATAPVASADPPAPPPSAPPGAFTTPPPDRALIARFLSDEPAKQTPEIYELALRAMASCEIPAGKEPTCPEWSDYKAVLKRPLAKGGAKKRLAVAAKHLQHAAPSVRTLAARVHATAKADDDFDALLAAAKVEPSPAVLAEMLASMTRGRPELDAFKAEALGHASPLVRAAACAGLAAKPGAWPLAPVQRGARDPVLEVRTACFTALTAAWVKTPAPRREAFDETLALLESKPRDPALLPASLGKLAEAKTKFLPEDTAGLQWLEKASFYEPKRLCAALEEIALDASLGRSLRAAALDALGAIDGKKRASSVREKLAALSDEASQALSVKPKKGDAPKKP